MSKIFFWASDATSACAFYRCVEPGRVLRRLGHDVTVNHQAGLADLAMADVAVIQRPTEQTTADAIGKLRTLPDQHRPRIVVELDDDLFSVPEHNPAHTMMTDPARRKRLADAIVHADRVVVTNVHLGGGVAMMREEGAGVRVVPNYVPERFVVGKVPELDAFGTPTLTWAGSDTHRRDFDEVAVALRRLLRERTDFRVRIVGAPYAVRLETAMSAQERKFGRVAQVPWIEGVPRYIPTLAGHIGLAPLADDLFNRSKSDLRLKELAARGMAVVASEAGPYADSNVPHMRVSLTDDWFSVLRFVIGNEGTRERWALAALDWAQRNTLEARAGEWEKALLD